MFSSFDSRLLDVVQNTCYGFNQDGSFPAHIVWDAVYKTFACYEALCKCTVFVDASNIQTRF